jgi:hypothetical protein
VSDCSVGKFESQVGKKGSQVGKFDGQVGKIALQVGIEIKHRMKVWLILLWRQRNLSKTYNFQ